MIKAVIFDFDGVLVDSIGLGYEANKMICQKFGGKFCSSLEEFKSRVGGDWKNLHQSYGHDTDLLGQEIVDSYVDFILKNKNRIKLLDKIEFVVKNLSQNYKLAIVSSSHKKIVEEVLRQHNLFDYFDIVTTYEHGSSKSDNLNKTLGLLDIKNHEAVYIGDMINDIKEGKTVNIKTIILDSHSWNHKEDLVKHNPDILISHPNQILEVLQNV